MANEIVQVDANKAAESIRLLGEEMELLGEKIGLSKISFNELRNRGWWDRAFSNNTKDLADGLARQAETIHTLLKIVQGVLFLNVRNTAYLAKVSEDIKYNEDGHVRQLSEYEKLTVDILDAAVNRDHKVKEDFNKHTVAIADIKNLLKDIQAWAEWAENSIKVEQANSGRKYEQLSQKTDATRTELEDIKQASKRDLVEAINTVNSRIAQREKDVAQLLAAKADAETVDLLKGEANWLKGKVEEYEKSLALIDVDINKLDGVVRVATEDLKKVKGHLPSLTGGLSNLSNEFKLVKQRIGNSEKYIADELAKKASVKDVESIVRDTKKLQSEVGVQAVSLLGFKEATEGLDALVVSLSERISQNERANNVRLANLQRNFYLSSGVAICAVIVAVLALISNS